MKLWKKVIFTAYILFTVFTATYASPADQVQELTLENGLSVFLLPDSSDALIRIAVSVKAGFSSQTKETNGFFKLYSRLVENNSHELNFENVTCLSDSTDYELLIPPEMLYQTLDLLSESLFSNNFSDDLIADQLLTLKNEVTAAASDSGTILNAGIDSKIFADAPWKHDSGIYPQLIKKTTPSQARNIITEIGNNWYTPQNSGLFISGNFDLTRTEQIISQTFGRYYSNSGIPVSKPSEPHNAKRKYVIHDSDFSPDITQIVVQYTMLNFEECAVGATMLNNNSSTLKQNICSLPLLNIPGEEYINIASASKNDSSRLIIQSLFQKSENKKTSSLSQVELFLSTLNQNLSSLDAQEFSYARHLILLNRNSILANSQTFMENLRNFWIRSNFYSWIEPSEQKYSSPTINRLFTQTEKALNVQLTDLTETFRAESPYIFVIINSSDYKKNSSAYKSAGFEEINSKNASWYMQEYYKQSAQINAQNSAETSAELKNSSHADFYQTNSEKIQTITLNNGIKVYTKNNPNSTNISIALKIKGGKTNSLDNNGFEEVMINLLATNIRKELLRQQLEGVILGNPEVSFEMELFSGNIFINLEYSDFDACCKAISNALIYGELSPAMADRAVQSRQYKKRLENGTAITQLIDAAARILYKNTTVTELFDSEKEILTSTNFTQILNGYQTLLDASKYTVFAAGNLPDNAEESFKQTIGLLAVQETHNNLNNPILPEPDFPSKKTLKTKIRHTFLTDIPAEKAGPMPAVLVPTTEFLDPVVFIVQGSYSSIFNAVLYEFESLLQKELVKNPKTINCTTAIQQPQSQLPFAIVIVKNVKNRKEVEAAYRRTWKSFYEVLSQAADKTPGPVETEISPVPEFADYPGYQEADIIQTHKSEILQAVQNLWIITELKQTSTNMGTVKLMEKGTEFYSQEPAFWYLEEYRKIMSAQPLDFLEALKCFEFPALTVYGD